jgi:hypothetical protein
MCDVVQDTRNSSTVRGRLHLFMGVHGYDVSVDAEFFTRVRPTSGTERGNCFAIARADMPNKPVVIATRRAAGA